MHESVHPAVRRFSLEDSRKTVAFPSGCMASNTIIAIPLATSSQPGTRPDRCVSCTVASIPCMTHPLPLIVSVSGIMARGTIVAAAIRALLAHADALSGIGHFRNLVQHST
jgi:hypothetical protein